MTQSGQLCGRKPQLTAQHSCTQALSARCCRGHLPKQAVPSQRTRVNSAHSLEQQPPTPRTPQNLRHLWHKVCNMLQACSAAAAALLVPVVLLSRRCLLACWPCTCTCTLVEPVCMPGACWGLSRAGLVTRAMPSLRLYRHAEPRKRCCTTQPSTCPACHCTLQPPLAHHTA